MQYKKIYSSIAVAAILLCCLLAPSAHAQAPNTWTQRASIGGTGRNGAFSFGNDTTGYIGGGFTNNNMWQYSTTTNTWSQKASYPGAQAVWGAHFAVGNKGYVGLGGYTSTASDFWEYDMMANTWTSRATFPGGARSRSACFVVNGKGYVCAGSSTYSSAAGNYADLWEYDPATNGWTQKANFPGAARQFAVGFAIGADGYVGTGSNYDVGSTYYSDFYRYNSASNTWTTIASYPIVLYASSSFSVGNKGYVGVGITGSGTSITKTTSLYAYDPQTNAWAPKASFPGVARNSAVGFNIGLRAYLGTGYGTNAAYEVDFYEYMSDALITGPVTGAFCPGQSFPVTYNCASPYFNAGNIFTAQLSDASGSFASPVNIGSVTATTAGTVTVTIPSGTPAGTGYRIRITGSSPAVTGTDNGTDFTIQNGRLYVDGGVAASGSGTTWATAFKTLNEALNVANVSVSCGNEIWVKAGTYLPTTGTSRDSSFRVLRNGIKLYGGFAGGETLLSARNITANPTILSGDIGTANDSTDNSYHVMTVVSTAANNIDTSTRIDGFTIRGGNATGGGNFTVNGVTLNQVDGGGIHLAGMGTGNECSPSVVNNTFTRNTATYGGGLYLGGYGGGTSSPVIRNCTFTTNTAIIYGGGLTSIGEAKRNIFSIVNSTFSANKVSLTGAFGGGGALYTRASLMTIDGSTVTLNTGNCAAGIKADGGVTTVTNTAFTSNTVTASSNTTNYNGAEVYNTGGAAVFHGAGDSSSYTNCTFTGNSAYNGNAIFLTSLGSAGTFVKLNTCKFLSNNGGYWGGVIANYYSAEIQANNCVFSNNSVPGYGGVMDIFSASKATFTQCVAANNTASGTGGFALNEDGCTITFIDCTLSNNSAGSAPYSIDGNGTPATILRNTIVWGTSNGSHLYTTGATLSNSLVRGITVTAPNLSVDPYFVNPGNAVGADGIWGTADDGIRLTYCSQAINAGSNALVPAGLTTDYKGDGRIQQGIVDMGAYESPVLPLLITKSHVDVLCKGAATGTATVNVSGASNSFAYAWSPSGGTGATTSGVTAGNYTVTITDASGCFVTRTDTIKEPALALATSVSAQTNPLCYGAATGTATVSATGGTGAYTYSWSPSGGNAASATGLVAGTYTVTVKDANNCSKPQTVTITQPGDIMTSISSQTNILCFGNSTGAATIGVTGGTGAYTYSWAPAGGTAASATGLAAGIYTVTVKDANNCTKTQTVNITQPAVLATSVSSQTNVACNGSATGAATIAVTGGTVPYTYSWSPSGGSAATATNLAAGTYTVTVKDANNCTTTQTVNITQSGALTTSVSAQTNVLCKGAATGAATIAVSGGSTPYTYSWAPAGGTAASATGLLAGNYTVTVKDANNCSTTQTVTITEPAAAIATSVSAQTNVLCFGNTTGAATVAVTGGTGTYTYSWAPSGGSAASASGLAAGTYTVTVKDANNCVKTQTVTITQPASGLTAAITSQTNVLCFGNNTGSATVTPSGGTSPYTYSWSPSGGTAATASGLAAGTYTVTVKDAGNCTATATVTITQPAAGLAATAGSQTNILCNGAATGAATVAVTGGTSPYTYSWSPSGGTAATATGLAAGTYTVTVKDAGNCTATQAFTITQPPAIVTSVTAQTSVACFGGSTGSATIGVTGGTGAYTYSWAPSGGTAATATGLAAGNYTVTVKDANNCTTTQAVTVTQPAAALSVTASSPARICAGAPLNLTAAPAGGTTPYAYSWTGPNGFTAATQNPSIAVAQVSMGGTYSLTVTDARSCTANATTATIVDSIPNQPANITGNGVVCGGSINAYSIAAVTGATSYTWTLPAAPAGWTGSSATTSLSATAPATPGTGTLSVAAVNGCGSSTPRTLSVAVVTTPAAPAAVSGSAAVCGGITQSYFTAPVDQATSYLWTVPAGWSAPAITGSSIATTPPVTTGTGNGAVTVKASNVCGTSAAASLAVTVTNIPAQPAAIAGNANVCGGTAQIYKIPKVAEAAAYTWTVPGNGWTVAPGSATDTFINTTAGTAANTVSVTASNQCGTSPVRTLAVSVTNVPGTAGAITGPDSVCTGSGAVTFATGQIAEAASYTWTLPPGWTGTSATSQISGTPGSAAATGAVTVKVTGTNSCGNGPSAQKTIIVNNPVTPAVALSGPSGTQCAGNALVWTATPSGGGLSPLYQWKVNGVNQGAPGLSNTFTSSALNTGDVVSVQMRTSLPCATTPGGYALASAGAVTISPQVMPGININATAPPDLCKDVPVTFYANTTGGGSAPVYRWSRNGTVITGATGPSYTLTGPANGDTLQVTLISNARCRITDSVASNKMGLSVSPYVSPVVSISANPGTAIGAGQTVIFTAAVANAGANPEVRWKRNGLAVAGTTGLSWTTSTLRDGDVISADLVSGARCATPFMVTSVNTLQMRVSTGVSTVSGPVGSISLYPNPSSGAFTVQVKGTALSNGRGRIGLEVLSATGQLVWQLVVAPDTRDWSVDVHLPAATAPGMYLIRIAPQDNPGNNTVLKFNVEK